MSRPHNSPLRDLLRLEPIQLLLAYVLLVACVSCAPIGGSGEKPPAPVDPVPPSGNAVEVAAAEYVRAYAAGLAAAATENGERAGDHSDFESAFKAWDQSARTVREREILKLNAVLNEAHKADFEAWSPETWRKVMGELAAGCGRAARE